MDRKNSRPASTSNPSSSQTSTATTSAIKTNKWNSGSKFNLILNNLEKTILNQFHSSQHQTGKPTTQDTFKAKQNAIKSGVRQKFNSLSSSFIQQHDNMSQIKRQHQQSDKLSTEQQVQANTNTDNNQRNALNRVALQSSNNDNINKRNTTLNKYQQRIVSTLRSSQNLLNTKLSIPPPHASDEARHENHRLLFGGITNDANLTSSNGTGDDVKNSSTQANKLAQAKPDFEPVPTQRASLSPASSAKSLPNLTLKTGEVNQRKELTSHGTDEESGFATYQSRRSLIIRNSTAIEHPEVANRGPGEYKSLTGLNSQRQHNQMFVNTIASHQSTPFPYSTSQHLNNTTSMTERQALYNNQTIATQNSNQVPISSLSSRDSLPRASNIISNTNQRLKREQYDDRHLAMQNFYNPHGPVPSGGYIDSGQQIYANAPPKPRRYQYYDHSQMNFPQMMHFSQAPVTSPLSIMPNGGAGYTQVPLIQPFLTPGNRQVAPRQLDDGLALGQVAYDQRIMTYAGPNSMAHHNLIQKQSIQNPNRNMEFQSGPSVPFQYVMRSKSSLEACDLMRYKTDKQRFPDPPTFIDYPSYPQQAPLNYHNFPENNWTGCSQGPWQAMQNDLHPMSSLNRSKSVSHLAPMNVMNYHQLAENRNSSIVDTKFVPISSASTTNLNLIGLGSVPEHPSEQQAPKHSSNQTCPNTKVIHPIQAHQSANNSSILSLNQQHQKCGAINNVAIKNSSLVRQQNKSVSSSSSTFTKLSLDDKIKSLLCDSDCGSNVVYQQSVSNDKATTSMTDRENLCVSRVPNMEELGQANMKSEGSASSQVQRDPKLGIKTLSHSRESPDRVYMNERDDSMGNRLPHQYYVTINQASGVPSDARKSEEIWRKNDANSQLVVDLTTPRVLAKTQTNFHHQSNVNQGFQQLGPCSINQVGLPKFLTNNFLPGSQAATGQQCSNDGMMERTAPYYYSDLKSDEQRRALLNIVQQKSLSPPPQLLSRSIDQSNTRLAPPTNSSSRAQSRSQADIKALNASTLGRNQFRSQNRASVLDSNTDLLLKKDVSCRNDAHQSMLTLDTTSKGPVHHDMDPVKLRDNLSDGSVRGFIRSKSMENIGQRKVQDENDKCLSKEPENPVYENIRRTGRLLDAIDSTLSSSSGLNRPNNSLASSGDSIDSILGSTSDESSVSLDMLDEMKIPSSDDHFSDITQLIEQLKLNHSKLNEEYKSTMLRISATIAKRNKETGATDNKLTKKLHALEIKSKRCEQRSNNQLALIHMMEKVLKQTRNRSSRNGDHQANRSPDSATSHNQGKDNQRDTHPSVLSSDDKVSSSTPKRSHHQTSPRSSVANVIKAVVRESENPALFGTAELTKSDKKGGKTLKKSSGQSTESEQDQVTSSETGAGSQTLTDIKEEATNGKSTSDEDSDDGDNSVHGSASSRSGKHSLNESGLDLMRDDEDFIEFLTSESNGPRSFGASQFDASQFSASDFNNSTSVSESSGVGKDSLSSPNSIFEMRHIANEVSNRDTVKNDGQRRVQKFESNNNEGIEKNDIPDSFSDILGNVVDVDVCSVNLSQC